MIPINKRKKALPKSIVTPTSTITMEVTSPNTIEVTEIFHEPIEQIMVNINLALPTHVLRKLELSKLHGIPEKDIYVDPQNGVELYRTPRNTWVHNPENREDD